MEDGKTVPEFLFEGATPINATELRAHVRDILERARFGGEWFVVYTHGKAMAVVLGVGEFQQWRKMADGSG